jgi:glycosyltransferase involved in cell wall biosynthesis
MAPREDIDVLHVIGTLAPGGAERNLLYLAPWMARSSLRYGICCLMQKGKLAGDVEALGLPVFELGYRKRNALETILKLRRLLAARHVRVIHTHLFECGVLGRIAAWLAGTPIRVTHEHGKTVWKKWHHRLFERLAIGATDLRIAVSEDIRDRRVRQEGTPAAKIAVVGNAVEPSQFEVPGPVRRAKRQELGVEGCFVIGTVGRLVEAKAYDLLLEIAREVCDARPEVRFLVVGEGDLGRRLRAMRDSLGLAERVIFLGMRSDIAELLSAMDLYVITSRREGLPISLIEAMMASKPIVATAVGGIGETIASGTDGILVGIDDKPAFVRELMALIGDRDRLRMMGLKAREKAVARYAARAVLETLEKTYASIMAGKGLDWSRP